MAMYIKGAEQRRRLRVEEEADEITAVDFQAYGRPLYAVISFKYLGRFLTAPENDWPEVVNNLINSRRKWARFSRILWQEGDDARTSITFYNAFIWATLLFGYKTWAITPRIRRTLGGLHHGLARCLAGMKP